MILLLLKHLIKLYVMEMQACANHCTIAETDSKIAFYNQGFTNGNAFGSLDSEPKKMRILFSGTGKSDFNMGMAPIPSLPSLELKIPYN